MGDLVATTCGQWIEVDDYSTHVRRCLRGCRLLKTDAEKNPTFRLPAWRLCVSL